MPYEKKRETRRSREKRLRLAEQQLTELVHDWLIAHGAEHNRHGHLVLETTLGKLTVQVINDWIACRFEDEKRAAAAGTRIDGLTAVLHGEHLNTYSGKWNHGCGEEQEPPALFERWAARVARILPGYVLENRRFADDFARVHGDESVHEFLPGIGPRKGDA